MKRLVKSVILLMAILLAANTAVTVLALRLCARSHPNQFLAVGGVSLWHFGVLTVLLWRRRDFLRLPNRTPLRRVNFANVLTLVRLTAAPTVAFILIWGRGTAGVVVGTAVTALVFLTDLADGQISRRTRQRTVIGSYLDSTTDYVLLIVISAVFVVRDLLSLWFVLLLGARLLFQALAMAAVLIVQRKIVPRTSLLGKASIAAAMAVYGLSLLQVLTTSPWAARTVRIAEIVAAVIIGVSVLDKGYLLVRTLLAGESSGQEGRS
ncbi:MAG: CDP-alcohol phosphatidyltransferase family protein [Spirochaetaceae bacterium]